MAGNRQASKFAEFFRSHGWTVSAVGIFLLLFGANVAITTKKNPSDLEQGLLNFILFGAGVAFSWYSGRRLGDLALKRDGRKSIRRLLNLAGGMQNTSLQIDAEREFAQRTASTNNEVSLDVVQHSYSNIQRSVNRELTVVADAIEDWTDVVPETVSDVKTQLENTNADE